MTDDQRTARDDREPDKHGPAGAARWAAYLDWVRQDLAGTVLALPEDERRTTRLPSGWTPIEMLSHVLHMEQRWFVWGFLGEQVAEPWGDWDVDEPWDPGVDGRWTVADDATAEDLAARLAAIGARTGEILRTVPLETTASPGGRFADDPPTLEWICFHVLAEYARHAGQLDVAVEVAGLTEGATGYGTPVTSAPPSDETMLEIDVRKERGHTVVVVAGELDVFTSARLRTVLFDPVLCDGPQVVVDLGAVTFIDSTSIGVLVAARRWLGSRDAEVRIVSAGGPVLKVLELVKLDKVFGIYPSVDEAIAGSGTSPQT